MNEKLLKILGENVADNELETLLSSYQKLFNLKTLKYKEKVSNEFLSYCKKGNFFIEVIAYDSRRRIFVQRDLVRNKNAWELIGGWINKGESFEDTLDRVVDRETGSILVEALPVGIIQNKYYTDTSSVNHTGILYIGRIKDDKSILKNGIFTKNPEKYLAGKDKKIVKLGQDILKSKVLQPPVNEVVSYSKNKLGHIFHKYIVKPISYFGSSRIIQRRTLDMISKEDKSVLDVACGDDPTVLKIQRMGKIVVANDIARNSFKKISLADKDKKIIFSNQNMLDMKFGQKFDVAIVKNVMHHLNNPVEIDCFLNNIKSVAKKIVIIDIIDPKLNMLAKLWNMYYIWMLDDQGDYFINYNQFCKIMKLYFSDTKLECSKIWTVKGPYMMAVVNQ